MTNALHISCYMFNQWPRVLYSVVIIQLYYPAILRLADLIMNSRVPCQCYHALVCNRMSLMEIRTGEQRALILESWHVPTIDSVIGIKR